MQEGGWRLLWPRPPYQRPQIGAGTPPSRTTRIDGFPGTRDLPPRDPHWRRGSVAAGSCVPTARDPWPASPFQVIQRKQPQARSPRGSAVPQARAARDPQGAGWGRGQRTLPRRDWLRGVADGRKPRRATSAGSESCTPVSGVVASWLFRAVGETGSLPAEVSGAAGLGGERGHSCPQGFGRCTI